MRNKEHSIVKIRQILEAWEGALKGEGHDGNYVLVDKKGHSIGRGVTIKRTNGGADYTLSGGKPPHKPSSTGKIWAKSGKLNSEFFPRVFGLKWIKDVMS